MFGFDDRAAHFPFPGPPAGCTKGVQNYSAATLDNLPDSVPGSSNHDRGRELTEDILAGAEESRDERIADVDQLSGHVLLDEVSRSGADQ